MTEISVLIADEQPLMAESLAEALSQWSDLRVVGFRHGGRDAIQSTIKLRPDVVLYDYWMPGTSGTAAVRYLSRWAPRSRLLLMSWLHGPAQTWRAYQAGAALIPKRVTLEELAEVVRRTHEERPLSHVERVRPVKIGDHDSRPCWERLVSITPRELEILQLLAGETSSLTETALDLGISVGTARNHLQRILRKTGSKTRIEALEFARHEGLVREPGTPLTE